MDPNARGYYDHNAFLQNLDKQMEAESKQSTYKSSKKAPVNPNQAFLDRLDAEMKKEEENSSYKPYVKKTKPPENRGQFSNKEFLARLDAEMEKEKNENPNSTNKNKPKPKNDPRKDFLDRLDKAMENDAKNPYVPTKKEPKKIETKEDAQKKLLERIDKEMENDTYKPSEKKKVKEPPRGSYDKNAFLNKIQDAMDNDNYKPSERKKNEYQPRGSYSKEAFLNKIEGEMEKEKEITGSDKPAGKGDLICYICYKSVPCSNYLKHLQLCENNFRSKNYNANPELLKPKEFNDIKNKLSSLSEDDIKKYNNSLLKQKDDNQLIPCQNCARNIMKKQMEEHLKTCKPMEKYKPKEKINIGKTYDLDALIKEDQEKTGGGNITLVPCKNCGRKFAPDRLDAHHRACKGRK